MKVIIFGVGQAYENRRYYFENNSNIEIVAFIDNNKKYIGEEKDGVKIYIPDDLQSIDYDVIVILSNRYANQQKKQLVSLGISEKTIWSFYDLKKNCKEEIIDFSQIITKKKLNILIITYRFGLDGGSLAALHLAKCLKSKTANVVLSMDYVTESAKKVFIDTGIPYVIHRPLPYMSDEYRGWMNSFQVVIVNTVQMLPSVLEIHQSEGKKVILWVHEGEEIWYKMISQKVKKDEIPKWLHVLFVSDISRQYYRKYYPLYKERIVPIAIPDRKQQSNKKTKQNDIIKLCVIAPDTANKNLDLLINAIKLLPEIYKNRIEANFVGVDGKGTKRLKKVAESLKNIKFKGVMIPARLHDYLDEVDCVICTSISECLPTVAIEGFMHECVVVVPDSAGIAMYITNREDGYVYKSGSEKELKNCIVDIIDRWNDMPELRKKARDIYENNFTFSILKERLCDLINNEYSG